MCFLPVIIPITVSNGYLSPLLFLTLLMRLNILPYVYKIPPLKKHSISRYNHATVRKFVIISEIFNIVRLCTNANYTQINHELL